jgi:hypothetical protein
MEHCPGTQVDFDISEGGDKRAIVRMDHSRIQTKEGYEDLYKGWTWALDSPKSYLETGKPIPQN